MPFDSPAFSPRHASCRGFGVVQILLTHRAARRRFPKSFERLIIAGGHCPHPLLRISNSACAFLHDFTRDDFHYATARQTCFCASTVAFAPASRLRLEPVRIQSARINCPFLTWSPFFDQNLRDSIAVVTTPNPPGADHDVAAKNQFARCCSPDAVHHQTTAPAPPTIKTNNMIKPFRLMQRLRASVSSDYI